MATDVADWTQAVNVTGGSVAITGTATVSIVGTPTVAISGTPNVNIANTPAVTISSGTVTIGGTPNINILSQSVTVSIGQQWTSVGSTSVAGAGAGSFDTSTVPVLAQQLGVMCQGDLAFSGLTVKGNQSGLIYLALGPNNPISLATIPIIGALDTTFHVSWSSASGTFAKTATALTTSLPWAGGIGQTWNGSSLGVSLAADQVFDNGAFTGFRGLEVQPMAPISEVFSQPAGGTNATITLAAVVGNKWVLQSIAASLAQFAAAASIQPLTISDGGVGRFSVNLGVDGTLGHVDHVEIGDFGFGNLFANAAIVMLLTSAANIVCGISLVAVQR